MTTTARKLLALVLCLCTVLSLTACSGGDGAHHINAYGYNRGDLQGMPQWCITVGMKQILAAKKIYIALNRPWQHGPLKHALLDEETASLPASLLRRCPDVTYCGMKEILEGL